MSASPVPPPALRPTLWRTARVLANRKRLRLFECLMGHDDLSVDELAYRANLRAPLASFYLRMLNARGLIQVRRVEKNVLYRIEADRTMPEVILVVAALRNAYSRHGWRAREMVYRTATAVTHPRRLALLAALGCRPCDRMRLMRQTGISKQALGRHLLKLHRRGLIREDRRGIFRRLPPRNPLAQAILALADAP